MDRPIGFISRPFWRTPAIVRTEWNLRTIGATLVAILMLTVIGWLYLEQAAMYRESEMDIEVLERQRMHLMQEHRNLQWQIAESQSARHVLTYAGPLNLQDPTHIDTLEVPLVAGPIDVGANSQVIAAESKIAGEDTSWLISGVLWLETLVSPQSAGD